MKKYLIVLLSVLMLTLTACNSETKQLDKYLKNHYKTLENFEAYELETTVFYEIDDNETELKSYIYRSADLKRTCIANKENDPSNSGDTVTCSATYGTFNDEPAGYVPFPLSDGKFQVHPIERNTSIEDMILGYMTDENIIEQNNENHVHYRITVNLTELPEELQHVATSGFDTNNRDIPVILNAIYNKELEMFTEFKIDNSDVMQVIYNENFGVEMHIQKYSINYEFNEYTEKLEFFAPKSDLVFDDHVNFFEDGDHYGYTEYNPGDTIEGEIEYNGDQDIVRIYVPTAGVYNLSYLESDFHESILFSVYSNNSELLYEGIIGEAGHQLADAYMDPGYYYILLFSGDSTEGYKLEYSQIS